MFEVRFSGRYIIDGYRAHMVAAENDRRASIVKEIEEIQLEHAVLDSKLLVGALNPENVNLAELISGFHEWAERFLDMKIRMEGILEGQKT